ncbi:hypothetical protein [Confluentibacter sediminis]|uniref:hypothetical protein n=1 Tax=Confluentibacter sediminis TaxID=2219045 RepID=UPI000DAEB76F|nr:hypothetical protein [Confluentibacter sediminis]
MFNQRKNKSFNYKPRFSRETDSDANLEDTSKSRDFISKWKHDSHLNKRKVKAGMSMRILILILVLLLICMYVLEKKYM